MPAAVIAESRQRYSLMGYRDHEPVIPTRRRMSVTYTLVWVAEHSQLKS
jgi:hypothetical protein